MIAADFDLRRLRKNDGRLTSLLLMFSCKEHPHQKEQIADLQSALQKNTVITNVMISTDDSFARSSSSSTSTNTSTRMLDKFEGILRQIGRLPNLQCLQLSSPSTGKGVFPVRALAPLLQETTQLQVLVVHDLALAGTQADFQNFAVQVQNLWFLQRCALEAIEVLQVSPTTVQAKPSRPSPSPPRHVLS